MGELELAEHSARLTGKRKVIKLRGSKIQVDYIKWLKGEVARLEREVMEARERSLVINSTPSFFVLFRWAFFCALGCRVRALSMHASLCSRRKERPARVCMKEGWCTWPRTAQHVVDYPGTLPAGPRRRLLLQHPATSTRSGSSSSR